MASICEDYLKPYARRKHAHFAKCQEACRKDVERAFGVLQSRFAVIRYPALTWSKDQLWEVMNCCVILHNMIIESEKAEPAVYDCGPYLNQGPLAVVDHQIPLDWTAYLNMRQEIRDPHVHRQLQEDLVDHLWIRKDNA